MRDHPLVMNERRALVAYSSNSQPPVSQEFLRFLRGAGAALDWATGAVRTAPVSSDTPDPTPEAIAAEVRHCDKLLGGVRGPVAAVRSDPHYLNGVEHALRWLLGLESEPPVPLDGATAGPKPSTSEPSAESAPAA
jgi:hypothetical protein